MQICRKFSNEHSALPLKLRKFSFSLSLYLSSFVLNLMDAKNVVWTQNKANFLAEMNVKGRVEMSEEEITTFSVIVVSSDKGTWLWSPRQLQLVFLLFSQLRSSKHNTCSRYVLCWKSIEIRFLENVCPLHRLRHCPFSRSNSKFAILSSTWCFLF